MKSGETLRIFDEVHPIQIRHLSLSLVYNV